VYLGYVTSGGEIKMEDILKWPIPTNVIEVRIFVGVAWYLWNFIKSFSVLDASFHTIIIDRDKSF
jgi:hypothetical protein